MEMGLVRMLVDILWMDFDWALNEVREGTNEKCDRRADGGLGGCDGGIGERV